MTKIVQSTTERIMRKRARKQELRQQYLLKIAEEAKKLGITVQRLLQQKTLECEQIRQESRREYIMSGRSGAYIPPKEYSYSSYW
ncbi:MAG: hypothetical protein WC621_01065 [Patescibacteria group bacterium]